MPTSARGTFSRHALKGRARLCCASGRGRRHRALARERPERTLCHRAGRCGMARPAFFRSDQPGLGIDAIAALGLRRGFTLVEVLVALAILAVALAAGFRSGAQSADSATALKARTLALGVPQNRVAAAQRHPPATAPGERTAT